MNSCRKTDQNRPILGHHNENQSVGFEKESVRNYVLNFGMGSKSVVPSYSLPQLLDSLVVTCMFFLLPFLIKPLPALSIASWTQNVLANFLSSSQLKSCLVALPKASKHTLTSYTNTCQVIRVQNNWILFLLCGRDIPATLLYCWHGPHELKKYAWSNVYVSQPYL